MRVLIRQRRWWWVACNPDEALGTVDTQTYIRARSRERLLAKAGRRWGARQSEWEEVHLPAPADKKAATT